MIRIVPKPPPASLADSHRQQRADAREQEDPNRLRYEGLSPGVNEALRRHLFEEQHGRCAYCERALSADLSRTKIEHFHPRNPASPLAWTVVCGSRTSASTSDWDLVEVMSGNLLLCCEGDMYGKGQLSTCDARKGNAHICDEFYNPKAVEAPAVARIAPNGRAVIALFPGTAPEDAQRHVDTTLGLNIEPLVELRRRIFSRQLDVFRLAKLNNKNKRSMAQLRSRVSSQIRADAEERDYVSTHLSAADWVANRH